MKYAIQWLRSLIFVGQMYVAMGVVGILYGPFAFFSIRAAYAGIHAYCNWVRWSASWMVGLKSEIRGKVPSGEVLLAPKHQSFFDIIIIASAIPEPKFIMKASLVYAPVLGQFGKRIGCVPVDRGRKAEAVQQMVEGVTREDAPKGQLIIYPQGTRVAPGVKRPFKIGIYILQQKTGQKVIPAATNVGVFWPRVGIYRKPGLAVVEFLEPVKPDLGRVEFMSAIETAVETHSNALMREAGFDDFQNDK
ncbi:MAG: lysophospholipid acyltransferase family protein [Paracoccaceae bacterium]|nr:lysophospholipid acyltransferase family protein [Paracoccaceae bacterium]MDG1737099.1 lysophospholipid acyltransferase family protein [Paracoccaceae bacterium]MDG2258453.1 lysophospholipid acyltransferase family protein [Paracoccaceae bacterium]